jgi:hypothetical protein
LAIGTHSAPLIQHWFDVGKCSSLMLFMRLRYRNPGGRSTVQPSGSTSNGWRVFQTLCEKLAAAVAAFEREEVQRRRRHTKQTIANDAIITSAIGMRIT